MAPTTVRVRVDVSAANQVGVQMALRNVADTTRRVLNRSNVLTPVRTGNLRSHNNSRVGTQGLVVRGEVFNDTDYAAAVHGGTRARVIRPRTKKVLRFKVGGEVVFAARVNYPGTKGRPWLRRSLEEIAGGEGYRITTP